MIGGRRVAALALGALALAAAAPARELVDDTGVRVSLPDDPRRVACLAPDLTEAVFDLGAGPLLVGRCDACDEPEAARAVPSVGPMIEPSIEALLVLRPDVVFATSEGNPLHVVERLRALGLAVVGIGPAERGVARVTAQLRLVAAALGRDEAASRLAAAFDARLQRLRAEPLSPPVSACVLIWADPIVAAGRGSFLDDVLDLCGARNACARATEYPRLSPEDLLLAAPDVLVLAAEAHGAVDPRSALGPWSAAVPAVRTGRVAVLDASACLRPTLRLADAAERICAALRGR